MSTEATEATSEAPENTDNAPPEDVETNEHDEVTDEGDDGTGDDADNPNDPPEDDSEDLEFEGIKAKVPKALADAIAQGALRRDDYTRKTQAVAERAKALDAREAETTQRAEVYKANIAKVAELHTVEADLKTLNDLTQEQWDAIKEKDRDSWRELKDQHRDLKDKQAALKTELDTAEAEAKRQAEETSAKEFSEARTAMGRALFGLDKAADGPDLTIPGLTPKNAGETFARIETFASKTLGISPAELAKVTDPRVIKGLHLAMTVVQAASVAKGAKQVEQAQKTQPAKTVSGSSPNARRATDASGDHLSTDEWMRRRNKR